MDVEHLFVTLRWNLAPAAGQEKSCEGRGWGWAGLGLREAVGLPSWPVLLIVLNIKLSVPAKVPDLSVALQHRRPVLLI